MSKTVITNAQHVVMQKIDMIYLGGSLRKEKRISSKKLTENQLKKSLKAELKLRNYIQKKYGKIDPSLVNKGLSYEEWLRRFRETNSKRRFSK